MAASACFRVSFVAGTLALGTGRFSEPYWIRLPLLTRKMTRAPSTGIPSRTTS